MVATEIVLLRFPRDFNSLHPQKRRHPVSIFSVDLNMEMCGLCVRSPPKVRASASDRNYCLDALDLPPSCVLYPSHTQTIVIPWSLYQASQSKNTAALTEPPPEYLRIYYSIPCLGFRASAPGMHWSLWKRRVPKNQCDISVAIGSLSVLTFSTDAPQRLKLRRQRHRQPC